MADVKWIKIVTDIFDDEKMYAIECMPDGRDIELIWFKILCLAGKCNRNGFLVINERIAYTDEMLAKIFRMEIGVVQRALDIFQSLEMIEIVNNSYMVSNWLIYQSGDRLEEIKAKNRERQQRFRDKQKNPQLEDKKRNVTNNVTNNVNRSISNSISISNSYSFNNNTNIDNYLYVLENNSNEYIDYIKRNEILNEVISNWFKYKDERKPKSANHYSETSINSLIKKIVKCCDEYGAVVIEGIIEDSISNNYQGIIWDKLAKQNNKKGENSSDRRVQEVPGYEQELSDEQIESILHPRGFD